jgi:hypothetical protein
LLNLDTLYVEELIGQLKADEEYHEHEGPEAKHAGNAEASSREAVDMAT